MKEKVGVVDKLLKLVKNLHHESLSPRGNGTVSLHIYADIAICHGLSRVVRRVSGQSNYKDNLTLMEVE